MPNAGDMARRMNVAPEDVRVIEQAATNFLSQESTLRQEALRYEHDRKASGQTPDPAIVRSFTVRRAALASAAIAAIQSQVSAASFSGLQQFMNTKIRYSIKTLR